MATTSPDNIWTPDSGDEYALTVDLATTAETVQNAIDKRAPKAGTTAQRNNFSSQAVNGALWWDTDAGALFQWTGGSWGRIAPEEDTGWQEIVTVYNGFLPTTGNPPVYRRIGKVCHLSGSVGRGSAAPPTFLRFGILPPSVRPRALIQMQTNQWGSAGTNATLVQVSTNGEILIRSDAHRTPSDNIGYTISGISFPVE